MIAPVDRSQRPEGRATVGLSQRPTTAAAAPQSVVQRVIGDHPVAAVAAAAALGAVLGWIIKRR